VNPLQKAEEATSARAQIAWQKRRPVWTRTDTARWLNARSSSVLAWLRRCEAGSAPAHSECMGRWLQTHRPALFIRAHRKLAACVGDHGARENLNVLGVLP